MLAKSSISLQRKHQAKRWNGNLLFSSFEIKNFHVNFQFSYKDPISDDLNTLSVYKVTCAYGSFGYICKAQNRD